MTDSKLERYRTILGYFYPEFITALVLGTFLGLFDIKFIVSLQSPDCYTCLSIANTLTSFIMKVAEGLSVGTVILAGQYEGQKKYAQVGHTLLASLAITGVVGLCISSILFVKADFVHELLHVPSHLVALGAPFLRTRAIGILFMFLFLGLVGFLRGVKNTRAPMYCYVIGAITFITFDYLLIFGKCGFPELGFQGSAVAFTIQYIVMFLVALLYILFRPSYAVYRASMYETSVGLMKSIVSLSWPVMFDKAALQIEKVWLLRLIAPMGGYVLGALGVIKDMEALAFVPAVAFGQVTTLLASNEYGAEHYGSIKTITRRIIFMSSLMVGGILLIFSANLTTIIGLFDRKNAFSDLAASVFPAVSILVFLDLLQLMLAAALRGVANVRFVMWTRVISCIVLFIPLSYGLSLLPITNEAYRFVCIYGSFNIVNGVTSLVYVYWFSSGRWHTNKK